MLCSMCNFKEAVCEKDLEVDFGRVHVYLCNDCAMKVCFKEAEKKEFVQNDFWSSQTYQAVCPSCKMTADDFERSNCVGCEKCYETFLPEVEKAVTLIHGKSHHVGKVPENVFENRPYEIERKKMSKKLQMSIGEAGKFKSGNVNNKYFGGGI